MDLSNIIPGSAVGVLVILLVVFLVFKIIKVVIPLAIAAGIVFLLWQLGVFEPLFG